VVTGRVLVVGVVCTELLGEGRRGLRDGWRRAPMRMSQMDGWDCWDD
jgi:hypothetical protein